MTRRRLSPEKRLERLRKKFEQWREAKDGHPRIPKDLWVGAVELAGHFSINKVSKTLGISNTDLKRRLGGTSTRRLRRGKTSKPAFVELALPPSAIASECVVELTHPGGATMKISLRGQKAEALAALGKAFLNGGM